MAGQVLTFDDSEEEEEGPNYEQEEEEEQEDCFPEEDTHALVMRKSFQAHIEKETPEQREHVFLTKCKVKGELCDLIIDGGSEVNAVSRELVQKLKLQTTRHPKPFKLSCLDKGNQTSMRVDYGTGGFIEQAHHRGTPRTI